MARSTIAVRFTGDTADLKRSIDEVDGKLQSVGGKAASFAKKAAVPMAIAATAAIAFGKSAVDAGSNLNETLSKSNTVFGEQAAAIEKWANGAAKGFGQSKTQALEAASSFGNMFTQLGIGEQQASQMSTSMTELASDFASFHNADITEVLTAQQAAFRGEYDAVQRFVPTINAAAVEQKALELSGKKATKELTAQEKALAVQTLMMEGAGDAAGDFARTSDGLANKQRIQSARWADLTAKIGQGLIPVVSAVTGFITEKLIPGMESLSKWVAANKEVVVAAGIGIAAVLAPAFLAWAAGAAAAAAATLAAAAPVIAIGVAIAALTAGIIWAYQNWDWFRVAVDRAAQVVTNILWPALQSVARWVTGTLIPTIGSVISKFGEWSGRAAEVIGSVRSTISGFVDFFYLLPGKVGDIAGRVWEALKNGLKTAVDWIVRQLDRVLGPLDEIAGKVGGVIGGASGFGGGDAALRRFIKGERALGGPVSGGSAYLVGEKGPELFVPGATGTVIPNNALTAARNGPALQIDNITVQATSVDDLVHGLSFMLAAKGL